MVGGAADHEAISVLVLDLAIDTELIVAASVMDFYMVLQLLDVLDATINV